MKIPSITTHHPCWFEVVWSKMPITPFLKSNIFTVAAKPTVSCVKLVQRHDLVFRVYVTFFLIFSGHWRLGFCSLDQAAVLCFCFSRFKTRPQLPQLFGGGLSDCGSHIWTAVHLSWATLYLESLSPRTKQSVVSNSVYFVQTTLSIYILSYWEHLCWTVRVEDGGEWVSPLCDRATSMLLMKVLR